MENHNHDSPLALGLNDVQTKPHNLVSGKTIPLKNMKVSWEIVIPKIYGKIKNVPNHQPVLIYEIS